MKGSKESGTTRIKLSGPSKWLSPLKKFNKVAPSPAKHALKWTDDVAFLPLHSPSDSAILSDSRKGGEDGEMASNEGHDCTPVVKPSSTGVGGVTGVVTSDDGIEGLVEILDISGMCYRYYGETYDL